MGKSVTLVVITCRLFGDVLLTQDLNCVSFIDYYVVFLEQVFARVTLDHIILTSDAKPFIIGVNITMFRWEITFFAVVPLSCFLDEISCLKKNFTVKFIYLLHTMPF